MDKLASYKSFRKLLQKRLYKMVSEKHIFGERHYVRKQNVFCPSPLPPPKKKEENGCHFYIIIIAAKTS